VFDFFTDYSPCFHIPQAQCPSGWISNTDALGSVEQEYRLVSWSTFTTAVRCKNVLCKIFLTNRAVCIWNSLPNNVVSAESVKSFKSRLDRFWSLQDFVYDYRADLILEVTCELDSKIIYVYITGSRTSAGTGGLLGLLP